MPAIYDVLTVSKWFTLRVIPVYHNLSYFLWLSALFSICFSNTVLTKLTSQIVVLPGETRKQSEKLSPYFKNKSESERTWDIGDICRVVFNILSLLLTSRVSGVMSLTVVGGDGTADEDFVPKKNHRQS